MSTLSNYTFQDIFGIFLGLVLFPAIFIAPGYLTGWFLDLFNFRMRRSIVRFQIGVILSIAISPILFFLLLRFFNQAITSILVLAISFLFIAIHYRSPSRFSRAGKDDDANRFIKYAMWIALGWILFMTAFLIELQLNDRLYYNVVAHDFSTRVAIISAITRTGIPPVNPGYFPGHPVYLTYLYYFWYILCSLVDQLGGNLVDARHALIASVIWCGLALMATVSLYLRLRNPGGSIKIWGSALKGIGLLFVSGADIIAILLISSVQTVDYLEGDIEHWNEQITAWIGSLAWVPHHVAAMIACLAGVMLLLHTPQQNPASRLKAMFIAGLAFASAFGLSVFVTIVFVIFWGIWLILRLTQKDWNTALIMLVSGIVGAAAISPFLLDIIGNSGSGSTSIPLTIAVRSFWPLGVFIQDFPGFIRNILYLLALPLNYFLELGFFFIVGVMWLRNYAKASREQNPFLVTEIIVLSISLAIGSFVRSTVIFSNDIGWRAWLPGQFILLIWGVDILETFFHERHHRTQTTISTSPKDFPLIKLFLIIGLVTTITDIIFLRAWPLFIDHGIVGVPNSFSTDKQLGRKTLAARQMYEYINENLPQNTILQINPTDRPDRTLGLYANHQAAVSVHTAFGMSEQELEYKISTVSDIFEEESWLAIDEDCRTNFINTLIVNDYDDLWDRLPNLEKQRDPIYKNEYFAVFFCGR